jgi:Transposase IS4
MELNLLDVEDFDEDDHGIFGEVPDEFFDDIDEVEGRGLLGDWELLDRLPITIDIEPINRILLDHARQEVNQVMDNVLRLIPNGLDPMADLTPNDFFKVWFDRCLMESMVLWLSKYSSKAVSSNELKAFVKVELLLAFFNCTPERYYNKSFQKRYNPDEKVMTLQRYKEIYKALSTNDAPNSSVKKRNQKNLMQWDIPFSPNKDLDDAMSTFRLATAKIAFIRGVSMAVIDDDLLRLRSRLIAMFGFTQINNPAKGLGIIHHGVVSVVTSLFLCGHLQRRNESTSDAVTALQQTLSGASVERLINLVGNHFLWDRGYGGPDGVINRISVSRGLDVSGTAKRVPSFPFTFGSQMAGPRRKKIEGAGSEAMYWARKRIEGSNEKVKTSQYALGFRSGLGRVALMQTTYRKCGPGKYAFLTNNGKDNSFKEDEKRIAKNIWFDMFYQKFEEQEIERLTMGQSTPEWFLLRKFSFTGTTAAIAWRAACQEKEIHYFVNEILNFLGYNFRGDVFADDSLHIISEYILHLRCILLLLTSHRMIFLL